jgi:adenylylsulfate kinase
MEKILIMGLPGSGKTTLANALLNKLRNKGNTVEWFNADEVRAKYNDWDFSESGRIRQSIRMCELADKTNSDYVICDFVAPLPEMRSNFKADWTIWLDTIDSGRFEDTNKIFIEPDVFDFRVTEKNSEMWSELICSHIIMGFDG